jgi:hypothetical protein
VLAVLQPTSQKKYILLNMEDVMKARRIRYNYCACMCTQDGSEKMPLLTDGKPGM